MLKNLFLGIIISAFFVYLSFRGIDLGDIGAGLKNANLFFVFPVLCLLILIQVLRSYRWGIILQPLKKIDQFSLFSVTSVGFLAVIAIPARIGELARPYLISTKTGMSMSSAMGTIMVERVFDALTVLTAFFIVVLFTPLPPWLIRGSFIFSLSVSHPSWTDGFPHFQKRDFPENTFPCCKIISCKMAFQINGTYRPFYRWVQNHLSSKTHVLSGVFVNINMGDRRGSHVRSFFRV